MSSNAAHVYVLTRPATPGIVRIGWTDGKPDARSIDQPDRSLPGGAGEVFYARQSDDARIAVHILEGLLEAQAVGPAGQAGWFKVSPEFAAAQIDAVCSRVAAPEGLDAFADAFFEKAMELQADGRGPAESLDDAKLLLGHAAAAGHAGATYALGRVLVDIIRVRKDLTASERQALRREALEVLLKAGNLGMPRGFGLAAVQSLELGDQGQAVTYWSEYQAALEAGHESPELPELEVGFFVSFLFEYVFSGRLGSCPAGRYVRSNRTRLLAEASQFGAQFEEWLGVYAGSPYDGLVRSLAVPGVVALGAVTIFLVYPGQTMAAGAVALCAIGYGQMVRNRAKAKKARKLERAGRR